MLKSVAPEPHIPLRESRETWAAFLRAKLPPQICEFVYIALWCKLKVHARLEERIKLHTCPLCGCKETILHTWTQCRFMPLVHDLIHKYNGQVHVQIDTSSRQYRIMNLPSDHTLATIPWLILWVARVSHWSVQLAGKKNAAITQEMFPHSWASAVWNAVTWEPWHKHGEALKAFHRALL